MRELTAAVAIAELSNGDGQHNDAGEDGNGESYGEHESMAMAQIRRGQGRKRMLADSEVDADLALVEAQSNHHSSMCPNCEKMVLKDYLEIHVVECKRAKLEQLKQPVSSFF